MSKHQICVYLTAATIEYIDSLVKKAYFKSRSDFIEARTASYKEAAEALEHE